MDSAWPKHDNLDDTIPKHLEVVQLVMIASSVNLSMV